MKSLGMRSLVAVICCLFLSCVARNAVADELEDAMEEATAEILIQLAENGDLAGVKIAVMGFRDGNQKTTDEKCFPFAQRLAALVTDELVRRRGKYKKKAAYSVMARSDLDAIETSFLVSSGGSADNYEGVIEDLLGKADVLVTGNWRDEQDNARLTVRAYSINRRDEQQDKSLKGKWQKAYKNWRDDAKKNQAQEGGGSRLLASCRRTIDKHKVSKDILGCLVEDLDDIAANLARKLVKDMPGKRIVLHHILEDKDRYRSSFSRHFDQVFKSCLLEYGDGLHIVDQKEVSRELVVRSRGKKKDDKVKDIATSEAIYTNSNGILGGTYIIGKSNVDIVLSLKDPNGVILGCTRESIPLWLIEDDVLNPAAVQMAKFAGVSSQGLKDKVKISTTLGGAYQDIYEGQPFYLLLEVAQPGYLYIYNIDKNGKVDLLYPYDEVEATRVFQPKHLYTIPEGCDELEVSGPEFGLEAIKVFVSSKQLDTPNGGISAEGVVSYFRRMAARRSAELWEDTLYIRSYPAK